MMKRGLMAITEDSIDFLMENYINNSREWFQENKLRFKEKVEAPLLALAEEILPSLLEIDGGIVADPKRCLSRIWLDMRINRSGMYFRDHLWLAFRRGTGMTYPTYYFELSPTGYRYGVGYYMMSTTVAAVLRQWVLQGDQRFLAAKKALSELPQLEFSGESYKRKKYPDAPEELQDWLNRKSLSFNCEKNDQALLFSSELGSYLQSEFRAMADLYRFLIQGHLTALPGEEPPRRRR